MLEDLGIGYEPLWVGGALLVVLLIFRRRLTSWVRRKVWLYRKTQGPGWHLRTSTTRYKDP